MLSEPDNEAEAEEAEEGQREEARMVEETEAGDTVAEPGAGEEVNEGITTLMAACQQGLEHDVRSILRR